MAAVIWVARPAVAGRDIGLGDRLGPGHWFLAFAEALGFVVVRHGTRLGLGDHLTECYEL